jgi:methionyl-tRNA formyltransferase
VNLVFAGTPEFAATALAALLRSRHRVILVLTQPDRPAGRGLKPAPSPVKRLAQEAGLALLQPQTLRDGAVQQALVEAAPDVLVVAAYGLLFPRAVLEIPRRGCVNIHASLLPRWRGAAPIPRAILAGDGQTGITIMQMDEGLDTGPVLLQRALPIAPDDTAGSLTGKLAALGAQCIVEALDALEVGELSPTPQDEAGACYAPKIAREEAVIDWSREAAFIERQVRGFNPHPGAATSARGTALKLWRARPVEALGGAPGRVLQANAEGLVVGCGSGALQILELQRPGGRRLPAAEFLRGFPLQPGERLGG